MEFVRWEEPGGASCSRASRGPPSSVYEYDVIASVGVCVARPRAANRTPGKIGAWDTCTHLYRVTTKRNPPQRIMNYYILIHTDQEPPRSQDRRASTPLTARLSQNGGHARPQRRVPTSRMLSCIFLKTSALGLSHAAVTSHDKSRTTTESGALHARLDMLLTFADAHAKRPSRSQQIPYDAHRSAIRPNDISAADARAPDQM